MYRHSLFTKPVFLTAVFWIGGALWGSFAATVFPLSVMVPAGTTPSSFGFFLSAILPLLMVIVFRALCWDVFLHFFLFFFSFIHSFSLFFLYVYSAGISLSQCCCGFLLLLVCLHRPRSSPKDFQQLSFAAILSAIAVCVFDHFFIS